MVSSIVLGLVIGLALGFLVLLYLKGGTGVVQS